jgi:predicted Zn finger-like uncharacterized protein
MPNTIHCPSCNRELRVPDELLGKKVKCPACSTTFTASVAGPEAAPPPPVVGEIPEDRPLESRPSPQVYEEEVYDRPSPRQSPARSRGLAIIRPPAICLLVSSIFTLGAAGFMLLNAVVVTKAEGEAQFKVKQPPRNPQEEEMQKTVLNLMYGPGPAIFHLFFMGISLVVMLSSIMMMIGKMRWLAVMGSVLAILNFDCGCCLLGVPFGIWSLIALNNPVAKEAFK